MSFGKMKTPINIISTAPVKDSEGFVTKGDNILASVRAYKEERNTTEKWFNMAAFSTATVLFRFRKIPGVVVDTTMFITDASGRHRIVNAEDVRGRGMFWEVLCEKQEGTVR